MTKTIKYYNKNASDFIMSTQEVEFHEIQIKFAKNLSKGSRILDFGCGSGRDTKYFLSQGYQVDAIDASEENCRIASAYTGISVCHMLFQEMSV